VSSGYLLGKDISTIQEALRRLESRLDALEQSRKCRCTSRQQLPIAGSRSSTVWSAAARAAPSTGRSSRRPSGPPPFDWSATDESSTNRIQVGTDLFTFFAFMLSGNNYAFTDPSTYKDVIWPYVEDLYNSDRSAVLTGYRPTGWQDRFCVFGLYSGTLGVWNWLAVPFSIYYQDDDRTVCCESWTYGCDGNPVKGANPKTGWDPDVRILMYPYYSLAHYADCDYEYGLSFGFGTPTKQFAIAASSDKKSD
jgi:hypothetical protein